MTDPRRWRPHWTAYAAELLGTAALVFFGVGAVLFDFAPGLPAARLLPDPAVRRYLTGMLFGGVGAVIAIGPVGRASGAHLNPAVSFAFWLAGSLGAADAACYAAAQCVGGVVGALPLPAVWGAVGAALRYGATIPAPGAGGLAAAAGEAGATLALVGPILWFVGHPHLRPATPLLLPPLVAVIVGVEAPLSGASLNFARSLGPALLAHTGGSLWVYALGPLAGASLAALVAVRADRTHVAKIGHPGRDPHGRFHGAAADGPAVAVRRRLRQAARP